MSCILLSGIFIVPVWYGVYGDLSMMGTEALAIATAPRLFCVDRFSVLAFRSMAFPTMGSSDSPRVYIESILLPLALCPSGWTNTTPYEIVAWRSTRRFSRKTKNTQF